jgi:uncharacterized protein YkwD
MHVLKRWRAVFIALALMVVGSLGTFQPAHADAASESAQFVALLNQLRSSKGLRPLVVDGRLVNMAQAW